LIDRERITPDGDPRRDEVSRNVEEGMRTRVLWLVSLAGIAAAPPSVSAWPGCEEDRVRAVVRADSLIVHHDAATYNCCMDRTEYFVVQDASTIHIQETEIVTEPCTCLCCYSTSVQVADLAPGTYTLVFAWYDYDTGDWEQWSDDVTVLGNGHGTPIVTAAADSGCLDPTGAPVPAADVEEESWAGVKYRYR
jgi:hypothetical protein